MLCVSVCAVQLTQQSGSVCCLCVCACCVCVCVHVACVCVCCAINTTVR